MLYGAANPGAKKGLGDMDRLIVTNTESDKGHNRISSDGFETNFVGKAGSVGRERSIGGRTESSVSSGAPFVPASGGVEISRTTLFIVSFP